MTSPAVSVVMPAFNAARFIGGAISSVLAQTFEDLELVVIDDGSTDATFDIASAHEGPIRVVRQENAGVAAARNRGIAEARGKLVAFCDADDLLFPRHLETMVDLHRSNGGIITANAYWLFANGIDPRKTRHRGRFPVPARQRMALLEQNFVSTMSLFSRDLASRLGPFDETLTHAEDWDFWLRAVFSGVKVTHQPQPLALYRWTEDGLSSDRTAMDEAVVCILRRTADAFALRPAEKRYVERRLAGPTPQAHLRRADAALAVGDYREAKRGYRAAAALVPSESPIVWKARMLKWTPRLGGAVLRRQQARAERRRGTDSHVR